MPENNDFLISGKHDLAALLFLCALLLALGIALTGLMGWAMWHLLAHLL
jgi:hypothetical protein